MRIKYKTPNNAVNILKANISSVSIARIRISSANRETTLRGFDVVVCVVHKLLVPSVRMLTSIIVVIDGMVLCIRSYPP